MRPHACRGFGTFFLPEVGDGVVLGHFNDDPRHPVVLGSLYSASRKPPCAAAAENHIKVVVTRCGHRIEPDDDRKAITVTIRAANRVVLDDAGQCIVVRDQDVNRITLDGAGIARNSHGDITLSAQGGLALDAAGPISLASRADVTAAGGGHGRFR
jgi:uncharacterized protein involved in type VI secretion and phage assembly